VHPTRRSGKCRTDATLHEEYETPLPIRARSTPATVAVSLFQIHSVAVAAVHDISWLNLRSHAV